MDRIRIGGVPEHFNLPIHQAIANGNFEKNGIDAIWNEYKGGTGQMTQALEENECDLCIVLTEGIIKAITNNNPSQIVSGYVDSPLIWGIHTGIQNPIKDHQEVYDKRIAISRYGSGSHLMPMVDALLQGKKIKHEQFKVINTLDDAIESLNDGETDIFYWEKYTTKPYVKKNKLKRIGEFVSPWPCFVIAATDKIVYEKPDIVDKALKVIHESCGRFMDDKDSPKRVSKQFDITESDANYWFHATEWATNSWVSNKMIQNVFFTLKKAKLLDNDATAENLIWVR